MDDKKIGIVTLHNYNYGSLLQCYALQHVLKKQGYKTELVEARYSILEKTIKYIGFLGKSLLHPTKFYYYYKLIKSKRATPIQLSEATKGYMEEFEKKLNLHFENYSKWKYGNIANSYDFFVSGSDQIWGGNGMRYEPFAFLDFVASDKKIAYAPSFGQDYIEKYDKKKLIKYLKTFKNISVREKTGKKIVYDLLGENIPVVLDPTLLLSFNEWKALVDEHTNRTINNDRFVFLYFLEEPSDDAISYIIRYVEREHTRVIAVGNHYYKYSNISTLEYCDVDPIDFTRLIMSSEKTFTDSYHAVILSVNFNKQFYVFPRPYVAVKKQSSRITDFLEDLGLSEYYIDVDKSQPMQDIDYVKINEKIEKYRKNSLDYLESSLSKVR